MIVADIKSGGVLHATWRWWSALLRPNELLLDYGRCCSFALGIISAAMPIYPQ